MEAFKFEERKILGERERESRGAEGKREMETEGKKQGQTIEMWKCTYQNVKSPSQVVRLKH